MKVKLNFDGGVRTGGVKGPSGGTDGPASIGFVIRDEDDKIISKGGMHIGTATVNEAEYSALICGLYNCHTLGAEEVEVESDSQIVVNHMKGTYALRAENLRPYFEEAKAEAARFAKVTYSWVPRKRNTVADQITRDILDGGGA